MSRPVIAGEVRVQTGPRPVSAPSVAGRAAEPDPDAVARLLRRRRGSSEAAPGSAGGDAVSRLVARRRRRTPETAAPDPAADVVSRLLSKRRSPNPSSSEET